MTCRRGTGFTLREPAYVGVTTYRCAWYGQRVRLPAPLYIGEVAVWGPGSPDGDVPTRPMRIHRDVDLCSPVCRDAWARECQSTLVAKLKEVYGVSYDASSIHSRCR